MGSNTIKGGIKMTLSQTIGFYLAIAGMSFSITTIALIALGCLQSAKRWFR